MQVVIYPGFAELIIIVNPPVDFQLKEPPTVIMPSLYAPWLDARDKGSVNLTIQGETLRFIQEHADIYVFTTVYERKSFQRSGVG